MFCSNCGAKAEQNTAFCSGCGANLNKQTQAQSLPAATSAGTTQNAALWRTQYAQIIAALAALLTLLWFIAPYYSSVFASGTMLDTIRETLEIRNDPWLGHLAFTEYITIPIIFLAYSIITLLLAITKQSASSLAIDGVIGLAFVGYIHLIDSSMFGTVMRAPGVSLGLYFIAAYLIYAAQIVLSVMAWQWQKRNPKI